MENNCIIYRRKDFTAVDHVCISSAAGIVFTSYVWCGGSAYRRKICVFCGCFSGIYGIADYDNVNKSDQQFCNGNDNFTGTADRKRKQK